MPNSRISDLTQKQRLLSNGFDESLDDEALLLLARAKSHNETIAYKDFKTSLNDHSVQTTGNQDINGEKTFNDDAFFKSGVAIDGGLEIGGNLNVDGHFSVKGDIFNLKFETGTDPNALNPYDSSADYAEGEEVSYDLPDLKSWRKTGDQQSSQHSEPGVVNGEWEDVTLSNADQYLTQLDSNLSTKGDQEVDGSSLLKGDVTMNSDALIKKDLQVLQNTTLAHLNTLQSLTSDGPVLFKDSLDVKGQTNIEDSLIVKADITAGEDINISGDALLEGDVTTLKLTTTKKLLVNEDSQLHDTNINGSLEVEGGTTGKGSLNVKGLTSLEDDLNVYKNLGITGKSTMHDDVLINAGLEAQTVEVNKDLNITDTAFLVKGDVELQSGKTTIDQLEVENFTQGKDLSISEKITTKLLEATGESLFKSGVTIEGDTSAEKITANKSIHVSENSVFNKNIQAGSVSSSGSLEVGDSTTLKSTLKVEGDATFDENLSVGKSLTVRGDIFNVKFSDGAGGDLDTFSTNFDSDLTISGKSYLEDDVELSKNISIQEDINLNISSKIKNSNIELIYAEGDNACFGDGGGFKVQKNKNSIAESNLHIKGDGSTVGDLNVGSNFQVQGTADIFQTLTAKDETYLEGKVLASDDLGVQKNLAVTGSLEVKGQTELSSLNVDNKVDIDGALNVEGLTKLMDRLEVSKQVDLGGELNVEEKTTLKGSLEVMSEADFKGSVKVEGKTDILNELKVTSKIFGESDITVTGTLFADKALYSNIFPSKSNLPDAATYHGLFAHAHSEGKAYFSHSGLWRELISEDGGQTINGKLAVLDSFEIGPRSGLTGKFNLFEDKNDEDKEVLSISYTNDVDVELIGFYLTGEGRMGIGVSEPLAPLHLEQTSADDFGILVQANNSSSKSSIRINTAGQAPNPFLEIGHAENVSKLDGDLSLSDSAAYLKSKEQNLAVFSKTEGTDLILGAGDVNLVSFKGTKSYHPSTTDYGGNDIIFGEHANIGVNVPEVELSPVTQDKFKLHIQGEVKIEGRLFATDIFETYPTIPKVGDMHDGSEVLRPEHSYSKGDKGTFIYDDDYIFICLKDSDGSDVNSIAWKRFAISEW